MHFKTFLFLLDQTTVKQSSLSQHHLNTGTLPQIHSSLFLFLFSSTRHGNQKRLRRRQGTLRYCSPPSTEMYTIAKHHNSNFRRLLPNQLVHSLNSEQRFIAKVTAIQDRGSNDVKPHQNRLVDAVISHTRHVLHSSLEGKFCVCHHCKRWF